MKLIILIFTICSFLSCSQPNKNQGINYYNCGIKHLQEYNETGNRQELYLVLDYMTKADEADPNGKPGRFLVKVGVLMELQEYVEGMKLVESIATDQFVSRYMKNYFYKTFQALDAKMKGDTLRAKQTLYEIVDDLTAYLKTSSQDTTACIILYYTKCRLNGKIETLEEIDKQREIGNFNEALSQILKEHINMLSNKEILVD